MSILLVLMLALFVSGLLVQSYFTLVIHGKLRSWHHAESVDADLPPVSVIVCARNEEANLRLHLPSILEQEYPVFEVVVVNDCSFDETDHLLRELAHHHPNLKVVTIAEHERYKHGKKFAVTLGIKAATHELLLLTDADCRPLSTSWIAEMAAGFSGGKEIVLGYSPYERRPGLLNGMIRYETFITALNYLSFALSGDPYMGVGRNLAYRKTLFFKGKGFASHMHIPSGDDDLFVNQNANAANTAVSIRHDAQVASLPKNTWSSWRTQKIRHYGSSRAYKPRHKRILSMHFVSAFACYVPAAVLFAIRPDWWQWVAGAMLLRLAILWLTYIPLSKKLRCNDLMIWLPALDIFYYFYQASFSFRSLFRKKVLWK